MFYYYIIVTMSLNAADHKIYGIYVLSLLERKVRLHINEVGKTVKQNLENKLKYMLQNKCIPEGIIQNNSIKIISYTCGNVEGDHIVFTCCLECFICNPVEGTLIECNVKTVTKAGIHAEYFDIASNSVPLHIFVARDHHFNDDTFNNLKENDNITAKVIGTRYELNDPYICAIASISKVKRN
jgi:DNA-directed RNA polymerase subunit E'/Rpb7